MVTDDERREVAARLREADRERSEPHPIEWFHSHKQKNLFTVISECIDGRELDYANVDEVKRWLHPLARLADLIEPAPADDYTSDGYHTFGQLYYQRMVLWAAIVNANSARAWKTRRHEDGELCFGGGWFLVTIDTPEGAYGYHYEDTPANWELFRCEELPKAKPWDGYDERDVCRILSLIDPGGGEE